MVEYRRSSLLEQRGEFFLLGVAVMERPCERVPIAAFSWPAWHSAEMIAPDSPRPRRRDMSSTRGLDRVRARQPSGDVGRCQNCRPRGGIDGRFCQGLAFTSCDRRRTAGRWRLAELSTTSGLQMPAIRVALLSPG